MNQVFFNMIVIPDINSVVVESLSVQRSSCHVYQASEATFPMCFVICV